MWKFETAALIIPHDKYSQYIYMYELFSKIILSLGDNRLISRIGFLILVRWHLYIESGPRISYRSIFRPNWTRSDIFLSFMYYANKALICIQCWFVVSHHGTMWLHNEKSYMYLCKYLLNSLMINLCTPSAAYMLQWTGLALVQVMAYCLCGAKPLPEPMLPYCQLDPREKTSVKF